MNILVRLHKGYGLGDAVQMSSVLRHVAKHRPSWTVDFQAENSYHVVGRGLVDRHFSYAQPNLRDEYDGEVEILLFNTYHNWSDRPNTRVSSCLRDRFDIDWDPECACYRIEPSSNALISVANELHPLRGHSDGSRIVAVHWQGDSAAPYKDLSFREVHDICEYIQQLGYTPLVLDWRCKSNLPFPHLRTPQWWGGSPEYVASVIRQCAAFVGIDSGPGKCASATDVPSLIVWTKHHPSVFHDPAPNTVHLVPDDFHYHHPVKGNPAVVKFFEENYKYVTYKGEPDSRTLVQGVCRWLNQTLKVRDWSAFSKRG